MPELTVFLIRDKRRVCAACGRVTGTKSRPGVEFDWPCYVEGYPCGSWGRVESRQMVCGIHSLQVDRGRGPEEVEIQEGANA